MTTSIVLIAYEINAQTAKEIIQKRSGLKAKFRKFRASDIVDHVERSWREIEDLLKERQADLEDRILYTVKLTDPLRIGKTRNDILNNSFLMSALSDNTQFGREALDGARYYQLKSNSEFERKQFSLFLDEARDQFASQEVGIFGWVSLPESDVDGLLKDLASNFAVSNDGELHFIEITNDGDIFPNFSNVRSQKFEGKLAGNYSLTLKQADYEQGVQRINDITNTVTRKTAISVTSTNSEREKGKIPTETVEPNMASENNRKNSYTDDFKREVATSAQKSGVTLASVGEQFGVSPTLVRNWKIKFSTEATDVKSPDNKDPELSSKVVQGWIQGSVAEGTIDGDGDLYVSLEVKEEPITEQPVKLFVSGTQKLSSAEKVKLQNSTIN